MITLEQAKVGMRDPVDQLVVDEFRRSSLLLDALSFDNVVSPGTGGSTLAYGYTRLKTPSTASFRAINQEYDPNEADREEATAYCKIFGGSFKLDRVIINTSGSIDELDFQLRQKIEGASNLFHYAVINGDRAVNQDQFDGLDVMLTGSSTEYIPSTPLDISDSSLVDAKFHYFLDMMDEFMSELDGEVDMLLTNKIMATKMKAVARRAGYYTRSRDDFGRSVEKWNDTPIVDLRYYTNAAKQSVPVVPIDSNGETCIYAVQFGRDGFHGISPTGNGVIQTALPDLTAPGVIKEGDVEMVAGVVLKQSRKAGVLRGIKVRG